MGSGQVPAAFTQVAERTAVCKRQNSKSVCSLPPCSARHHNGSASVEEQILVLRVAESSKSHNSKADEEDFEEEEDYEEEGLEAEEE